MEKSVHGFLSFLRRYRAAILAALLLVLACYAFMLTHYTLQIDEETWIKNTDPQLIKSIWVSQGRFGLYLFDSVFSPLGRYIPILWDILAVLIYYFAGVFFMYSFAKLKHDFKAAAVFAFLSVFPALPFVTGDFLSFSMFNFQQAAAMLVMSLCFLSTLVYFNSRKKRYFALSIILGFVSVSFFQAFAVVYVTAVAGYFLLAQLYCGIEKRALIRNILRAVFIFIAFLAAYMAANSGLNRLFSLSNSAHAGGYIGWDNISENLPNTILGAVKAFLGWGAIGGAAIFLSEIAFVALAVALIIKQKSIADRVWLGLSLAALTVSPFLMNLLLLNWRFLGRILLALSLALALELLLIIQYASRLKWSKISAAALTSVILAINVVSMNLMFYGNYVRYTADKELGAQIIEQLEKDGINYADKPILFVGHTERRLYAADSDRVQSASFFEWDDGNNNRMHDFLRAEGYNTLKPADYLKAKGYERSKSMPCWPEEGSVAAIDDVIIVKLSEPSDKWFSVNNVRK